jgi:hypothetical protein
MSDTSPKNLPWTALHPLHQQFMLIGMIAFFWNMIETYHEDAFAESYELHPLLRLDVIGRISSYDARDELLRKAIKESFYTTPDSLKEMIFETLGFVNASRTSRNDIIHARPFDLKAGLARTFKKRKEISVSVSIETLRGVVDRLHLDVEAMRAIAKLAQARANRNRLGGLASASYQDVQSYEQGVRACEAQLQEYLTRRRSLPPLPPVPAELPSLLATALAEYRPEADEEEARAQKPED